MLKPCRIKTIYKNNRDVSPHNQIDNINEEIYFVVWDGLIFLDKGGYHQRNEDLLAERALSISVILRTEKMESKMLKVQEDMSKWTRQASLIARYILWIELLLLVAAFLSIVYDHPDSFEWFWFVRK